MRLLQSHAVSVSNSITHISLLSLPASIPPIRLIFLCISTSLFYLQMPLYYPSLFYYYTVGVVDHGIFAGFTTAVIVAGKDGVRVAGAGGEKPWW